MPTDPTAYKGRQIVQFPRDKDNKNPSILMLPIVSGTNIVGYLPAKATDNGDGTASLVVSGGGGSGAVIIDNETPSGAVDGMNDTFTTANQYAPGTTHLYVNGIRQKEGVGFDYVEQVDNETLVFEAGSVPQMGDVLIVDYREL